MTHPALLLERLLDADALLAEDGAALQAQLAEARRLQAEGDLEAARRQVESLALFTEALVRTDALPPADGQAVIETARRILAEDAGGSAPVQDDTHPV